MYKFSNETVFRGHPDKVCDQISDAILSAYLRGDKMSRCAIEVVGGKETIFITGEVTSKAKVNHAEIALRVLHDVGYSNWGTYQVIDNVGKQSPDIALGTNEQVGGAGDQGMMFGYACDDTPKHLPVAQCILQELAMQYNDFIVFRGHLDKSTKYLPDGKAQITGVYDDDGKLLSIETFVISFQNCAENKKELLTMKDEIVATAREICAKYNIEVDNFIINNTGAFTVGGFEGDAGLTGRKIIVDTYQGFARHGGGAFSGKDPTKVDRSGAYMARYIAKSIIEAGLAKKCEVQLSYVIGGKEPLGLYINTFGTGIESDTNLASYIKQRCDLTPAGIRKSLGLLECNYEVLARFGHFGHHNSWETDSDLANWLRDKVGSEEVR